MLLFTKEKNATRNPQLSCFCIFVFYRLSAFDISMNFCNFAKSIVTGKKMAE